MQQRCPDQRQHSAPQGERITLPDEMAERPTLPPLLHDRLTARAEAIAAFIACDNKQELRR
jgi:hypothetical protein